MDYTVSMPIDEATVIGQVAKILTDLNIPDVPLEKIERSLVGTTEDIYEALRGVVEMATRTEAVAISVTARLLYPSDPRAEIRFMVRHWKQMRERGSGS